MRRPSICLAMIVKNEAHVVERALRSALPHIDYWTIIDTGSTDGTQQVIREFMKAAGKPGELIERPWVNFSHNRNQALELALPYCAYTMVLDADDYLVTNECFGWPDIDATCVDVNISFGSIYYRRPLLVRATGCWKYRGVIHEFLACDNLHTKAFLPGMTLMIGSDGARRKDRSTQHRDIRTLIQALQDEKDPFLLARYTFYLAQTYKDVGQYQEALAAYGRRATQGFWKEEVFYSLLQVARISERLGLPDDQVIAAYMLAGTASDDRAEAWHDLARFARERRPSRWTIAMQAASKAITLRPPGDGLFVEPFAYGIGILDEFSLAAHYTENFEAAASASTALLSYPELPIGYRDRVEQNLRFALKGMVDGNRDRPAGSDREGPRVVGRDAEACLRSA